MSTYTYSGSGEDVVQPNRTPRRPPAKCGTDGGYYRHRRITKTEACTDCLCAHAAAEKLAASRRAMRGVSS